MRPRTTQLNRKITSMPGKLPWKGVKACRTMATFRDLRRHHACIVGQADPADKALKLSFGAKLRECFVDVYCYDFRIAFFKCVFQETYSFGAIPKQRVICGNAIISGLKSTEPPFPDSLH